MTLVLTVRTPAAGAPRGARTHPRARGGARGIRSGRADATVRPGNAGCGRRVRRVGRGRPARDPTIPWPSPATCAGSMGSAPGCRAAGLLVEGSCGDHLGARMSGGEIGVSGDVGAWAGAEMAGGLLRIWGGAGARLGAAYPGARAGMTGGEIVVAGDAGEEAGAGMRRGLVRGPAGPGSGAGLRMLAGTVIALGGIGAEAGLGNRRGSLVSGTAVDPLPGYAFATRVRPPALRLQLRRARDLGLARQRCDGGRSLGTLVRRSHRARPGRAPDLRRGGGRCDAVHERTRRRSSWTRSWPTPRRSGSRSRRWTPGRGVVDCGAQARGGLRGRPGLRERVHGRAGPDRSDRRVGRRADLARASASRSTNRPPPAWPRSTPAGSSSTRTSSRWPAVPAARSRARRICSRS